MKRQLLTIIFICLLEYWKGPLFHGWTGVQFVVQRTKFGFQNEALLGRVDETTLCGLSLLLERDNVPGMHVSQQSWNCSCSIRRHSLREFDLTIKEGKPLE